MAGGRGSYPKFNVYMPDGYSDAEVRTVVAYEAAATGKRFSQALIDLVIEEADVAAYPDEVRERLAELERAARAEAMQCALDSGG